MITNHVMVFLTEEKAQNLELQEARIEALKYSKLLEANAKIMGLYEKQLKVLAQALGEKHQAVLLTQEQLEQLKKFRFGKSSEKSEYSELDLFRDKKNQESDEQEIHYKRKKKRDVFGRTPQVDLPRVEVLHTLSNEQVQKNNLEPWKDQFEISNLVNITPAKFYLEVHKRQKYLQKTPEGDSRAHFKTCVKV